MLLVVFALWSVCSAYYYINGLKSGLRARQWAFAGLLFGPMLLPLFSVTCHVALRRARGYGNVFIQA